ncbi:5-oxoprolinase subunit PxpB [Flagellimonas sp. 2504JD4-2]
MHSWRYSFGIANIDVSFRRITPLWDTVEVKNYSINIKPFGKQAVLIEWPKQVDESILEDILDFSNAFKSLSLPNWEMSAAYNSVTLVNHNGELDFGETQTLIQDCYTKRKTSKTKNGRYLWRIPVCYDDEFALDMEEVCKFLKTTTEKLIDLHTASQFTVYGIGFLPGFMYLGGLPQALEIPRRKEPRLSVDKGSVGLAGKQTGIYPQDSPGGWNIIGSCPIPVFDAKLENPCFVQVGDKIQFYQISRAEYDLHKIETEVGIYKLEKIPLDA